MPITYAQYQTFIRPRLMQAALSKDTEEDGFNLQLELKYAVEVLDIAWGRLRELEARLG